MRRRFVRPISTWPQGWDFFRCASRTGKRKWTLWHSSSETCDWRIIDPRSWLSCWLFQITVIGSDLHFVKCKSRISVWERSVVGSAQSTGETELVVTYKNRDPKFRREITDRSTDRLLKNNAQSSSSNICVITQCNRKRWDKDSGSNKLLIIATSALIITTRAWSSRGHVSVFQREITRYEEQELSQQAQIK